jgi:hypothetical protein
LCFARVDFLLKLNRSFDDVFVDPDRGGEKTDGPKFVPPVYLLDPGKTLAHFPTRVGFALSNDVRHGILWGKHDHQVNMSDLDAERLDFNVRMKRRNVEEAFFQILLEFPLEDFFTILGDPNNMVLMVICAVGTELDLHVHMVAKPPNENLQPSAAGFHPRVNTRGPQPDS